MNIREISKPITAKGLNESLAKKFGQRLNLEEFTKSSIPKVKTFPRCFKC
jgi:hypothetical protein